jgi:hypothetical protein
MEKLRQMDPKDIKRTVRRGMVKDYVRAAPPISLAAGGLVLCASELISGKVPEGFFVGASALLAGKIDSLMLRTIKNKKKSFYEILSAPYLALEDFPLAEEYFQNANTIINGFRESLGIRPITLRPEDAHILSHSEYDRFFPDSDTNLGRHDPKIKKTFIRGEHSPEIAMDIYYLATILFVLGHETVHLSYSGNGITKYSRSLNEGFTDWMSRQIASQNIPKLFAIFQDSDFPTEVNEMIGATIDYATEMTRSGFGYKTEVQIIEEVLKANPDQLKSLLKATFEGKPKKAKTIISATYGDDVSKLLEIDRAEDTLEAIRTRR